MFEYPVEPECILSAQFRPNCRTGPAALELGMGWIPREQHVQQKIAWRLRQRQLGSCCAVVPAPV
jgi:hypothetical protein